MDGHRARLTAPGSIPWFAAIVLNALGSTVPWTAHTLVGLKPPDPHAEP